MFVHAMSDSWTDSYCIPVEVLHLSMQNGVRIATAVIMAEGASCNGRIHG